MVVRWVGICLLFLLLCLSFAMHQKSIDMLRFVSFRLSLFRSPGSICDWIGLHFPFHLQFESGNRQKRNH
eukprot:jgi/Psemu1/306531/fgenesh1_kg.263_\